MARNVNNVIQGFSTPNTGTKTVGTSVVQLSASGRNLSTGVQVLALPTNVSDIFVSASPNLTAGSADGTDGFRLVPGASVLFPARTESQVYLISDGADQEVSFLSF